MVVMVAGVGTGVDAGVAGVAAYMFGRGASLFG